MANERQSPGIARRSISEFLGRNNLLALVDDAELLVSELVTNAVKHSSGDIGLSVSCDDDYLHIEVRDKSRIGIPEVHVVGPTDETGRGLALVEHIATRWGWTKGRSGKVVWIDLERRDLA